MRLSVSIVRKALAGLVVFAAIGAANAAELNRADLVSRQALRVCADPANLPFSNEAQEGFENKIADLISNDLDLPVEYTWFPQATGFVRNTLFAKRCDVIIGYAQGDDLVLNTNAYYRSTYALVVKPGSGLEDVTSLDDPRLKDKRIGIIAGTPPATIMTRIGLMTNAKPYPLMVDRRYEDPAEKMAADIRSGDVDAGILWGPIAGYVAGRGEPKLKVTSLKDVPGVRMAYRITMGVRNQEDEWKHKLNAVIAKRQGDIDQILMDYGVPLLDDQGEPIKAPRK
jgi:quinoprotein dehydrogenase-associated probable ABC transporter substrate-binding protein